MNTSRNLERDPALYAEEQQEEEGTQGAARYKSGAQKESRLRRFK